MAYPWSNLSVHRCMAEELIDLLASRLPQIEEAIQKRQLSDLRCAVNELKLKAGEHGASTLTGVLGPSESAALEHRLHECRRMIEEITDLLPHAGALTD